jgi:hypothetical protein
MLPNRYQPDVEFTPAAAGTRVRLATLLAGVAVLISGTIVPVLMLQEPTPPPWPAFAALGLAPVIIAAIWFAVRIQGYRVAGDELRIKLPLRAVRFPLAGLQSVTPDREALRGARKIMGNDGLRAITGRFRSKRLGRFHAYVTDTEHAVVLRWSDRCLVISPHQPSLFVDTVRKRAGLSR